MEINPDPKKQKLNNGNPSEGIKEQKKKSSRWTFETDLTKCIDFHSPIVSVFGDPGYWFKPLATGGVNNPYSLDLYDQVNTLLLAKVNGLVWGQFINSTDPPEREAPTKQEDAKTHYKEVVKPLYDARCSLNTYWHSFGKAGDHAEDAFLESFEQASKDTNIITTLRNIFGGDLFVTLKLSRSPCGKCTDKLLNFAKHDAKLHLRIKVQTLYEGDPGKGYTGASNIHSLIGAGVSVRQWNVPLHAKKTVRKKVGSKLTKLGQRHELSCWCPDSDDKMHDEYREYLKMFELRTEDRLARLNEFLNTQNPNGDKFAKEIEDKKYTKKTLEEMYKEQTKLKPQDRNKEWFLKKLQEK